MALQVGDYVDVLDEDLSGEVIFVKNNVVIIQTEDVGGAPHSFLKIIEGEDADLAWEVDLGEITDSGRDEIKASPVVVDLDFDGKQEIIVSYDLSGTFYVKAFSPELICSVTGWSPGGSHVTELLWTYSSFSYYVLGKGIHNTLANIYFLFLLNHGD